MSLRAVIFDWHGVLDEVTLKGVGELIVAFTGQSEGRVREVIGTYAEDWAAGRLDDDQFWTHVGTELQMEPYRIGQSRLRVGLVIRTNVWKKLDAWRERYSLAILSDCPTSKISKIKKEAGSLFQVIWCSGEKRVTKSQDDFYLGCAKELGVTPEECLVVDDRADVLDRPRRLGFQTHLFTGLEGLESVLDQG